MIADIAAILQIPFHITLQMLFPTHCCCRCVHICILLRSEAGTCAYCCIPRRGGCGGGSSKYPLCVSTHVSLSVSTHPYPSLMSLNQDTIASQAKIVAICCKAFPKQPELVEPYNLSHLASIQKQWISSGAELDCCMALAAASLWLDGGRGGRRYWWIIGSIICAAVGSWS